MQTVNETNEYHNKQSIQWLLPMDFDKRLSELRKIRGFTQQGIADEIDLHVNQIKRYEANTAQPTLETLVRLAKALHVTLDELVFSEETRGPSDDFRMQFEALRQFDEQEKLVARELLDSLILKHTANQLSLAKTG
ncbi:MAG: helix-turn-helix transcriptional regulator [Puniceicoccaceae bacterium]|nr:helix-turn-helix transcriptional regulator [Puniceicoccaceae bacterium]